jgi:hypothetical protein
MLLLWWFRNLGFLYTQEGSFTMNHRIVAGTSLALALFISGAMAADAIKSGPQVGSSKITPFNPLHVTGDGAGEKSCLV